MIRSRFLKHKGGIYFYTLHEPKLNSLSGNGLSPLKNYLNKVMDDCPDDYFNEGPRSSCLKFSIPAKLFQLTGHEMSELTKKGLEVNEERYKSDHAKVQAFMLEMDNNTIATEVPIWIEPHESSHHFPNIESPLTGHIDLLRVEDNNIWVWDYKPNAFKEKFASTQVYSYALMLSKRTGLPLEHFRCGYFDSAYTFVFNPSEVKLNTPLPC